MTAAVLLAVHLLVVVWLTLRPLSAVWVSPANLQPLATIQADLARGPEAAIHGIGGGMLMLAPLGVLLPLAVGHFRRRLICWSRTVFAAVMIAFATEFMQSGVPGHVANVDTVLLCGLGVGLTHLALYAPLRRWARRRSVSVVTIPAQRTSTGGQSVTDRASQVASTADRRHHRVGIAP